MYVSHISVSDYVTVLLSLIYLPLKLSDEVNNVTNTHKNTFLCKNIIVNEFKLLSSYYIHFKTNTIYPLPSCGLNSTTMVLLQGWL